MNLHGIACKVGIHVWKTTLKDWIGEERQCIICGRFEHSLDPDHYVMPDSKWHWMAGQSWRIDRLSEITTTQDDTGHSTAKRTGLR